MEKDHRNPTPITATSFIIWLKQTEKWGLIFLGSENQRDKDERERESERVFAFAFWSGLGIWWICERYTQKLLHSSLFLTPCVCVMRERTGPSVRRTMVGYLHVRENQLFVSLRWWLRWGFFHCLIGFPMWPCWAAGSVVGSFRKLSYTTMMPILPLHFCFLACTLLYYFYFISPIFYDWVCDTFSHGCWLVWNYVRLQAIFNNGLVQQSTMSICLNWWI